jgi:hypothetical protein
MVAFMLAGFMAALFSFFINKLALKSYGKMAVVALVPLLEEVIKSMTAFFTEAPLLLTHGVFGLVEAVHDVYGHKGQSFLPFFLSLGGHLVFGAITRFIYVSTGVLGYGILVAAAVHGIWNLSIITILSTEGK